MASCATSVGLGVNLQLQSSQILGHQTRGLSSTPRHCRGRSREHLVAGFTLQQRVQLFGRPRNYSTVHLVTRNVATPNDDSLVVGLRSREGGIRGQPSKYSSFNSKQADITELGFVRESEVRSKLVRKLSESNQYVRHLQKELQEKEDSLLNARSELAAFELELQNVLVQSSTLYLRACTENSLTMEDVVLVKLAQEVGRQGIKPGTRKINGRYIHSHLASRLEEMQKVLYARIKDVDAVRTQDVELVYYGMAEDVQVMGSFDGWTRGEQLSPESTGTFTKFAATIKLRPGRYEVKFLVDGEWQVSPDLPTVGEG